MNKKIKCYCGHTDYCDCGSLKEPKQETLEEAAERLFKIYSNNTSLAEGHYEYMMDKEDFKEASLELSKWQQEQDNKELGMWKLAVEKQEARCKALNSVISDLQKRMYSEEEVHKIIKSYKNNTPKVFLKVFYNEWFEQFNKK